MTLPEKKKNVVNSEKVDVIIHEMIVELTCLAIDTVIASVCYYSYRKCLTLHRTVGVCPFPFSQSQNQTIKLELNLNHKLWVWKPEIPKAVLNSQWHSCESDWWNASTIICLTLYNMRQNIHDSWNVWSTYHVYGNLYASLYKISLKHIQTDCLECLLAFIGLVVSKWLQ
jgi:hypothetical protein